MTTSFTASGKPKRTIASVQTGRIPIALPFHAA